jgi:3-phosphoshikimate 1-carboxyvinyltransferase
VLAAAAEGESVLTGIERARIKESNRVSALEDGLRSMGIEVTVEKNSMTIKGGQPGGAEIDSKGDHRIAMAFGVLGAFAGDTVIDESECVSKTYPRFWEALKGAGGEVRTDVK